MVADVDAWWRRAVGMGARVLAPIADRDYGLRDFGLPGPSFAARFRPCPLTS
jgi:hypothetical protein